MLLTRTSRAVCLEHDADVQLMLRVQRNDPSAFTRLVDQYREPVYTKLFRMLRQHEDAEDLTQDVFLRVFTHRDNYRPSSRFAAWMFRIVVNVGRNALRSRHRMQRRLTTIWNEPQISADARKTNPLDALLYRERHTQITAALEGIAERQSRALRLFYFEKCTHTEIATRLDVSPQAVNSLLRRGRERLRHGLRVSVSNDRQSAVLINGQ